MINRTRTLLLALATVMGSMAIAQPAYADQPLTVAAATRQLNEATTRLSSLNDQVESSQGQLEAANRRLEADKAVETRLEKQLSDLARYEYKQPKLLMRLFAAGSLSQAFGEYATAQILNHRQTALRDKQLQLLRQDQKARDAIASNLKSIEAARQEAQNLAAEAQAAAASAQADAVRQQAARVAAMAQVTIAARPLSWSGGSAGNRFSYGYCTWYVANRRPVPWLGNAIEWWANARAYGFAEGATPRVGSIMVTRESWAGHVAYVEAVNGDGSWTVSEMNYVGWNTVSRRTLRYGQAPIVGFIY